MERQAQGTLGAALLLAVLALVARLVNLDSGLWFDEIWLLVEFLRGSLADLLTTFESDNVHPLYAVLAWLSVHAFGEAPWAVRLPALLFGVGSVVLVHRYALRVLGPREAFGAALLCVFSSHHVSFSQNARGYTGLLFFTLLACLAFEDALRTGRRRAVVLQGVALALGTWVHLTGVFVALAQLAVLAFERVRPAERAPGRSLAAPLIGVVVGGAISLALHAPLLPEMLAFFTAEKDAFGATQSAWRTPLWMVRETARSLGLGEPFGLVVLGSGALVFAVGLVVTWRRHRTAALFALLPGLLGQGTMWLLGRNLWPRFFFSLAGFLLVVGVAGLVATVRGLSPAALRERLVTATLLAVVVLSAFLCRRVWTLPKQDFAGARAFVEAEREPGEPVFSAGLAMYPLSAWLETDYTVAEDVALFDQLERDALVVVSGGTFTSAYYPEVWQALVARGREVARFASQNADLDVVVLRLGP